MAANKPVRQLLPVVVNVNREVVKAIAQGIVEGQELPSDLEIANDTEYANAGTLLTVIAGHRKRLEEERRTITRQLDAAKRAVMDEFEPTENRLDAARQTITQALGAYERARRVEQERLAREAEERARKERERLAKQAERAAAKGQEEKAASLALEADLVTPAIAPTAPPKVPGYSSRSVWKFQIVDHDAIPREFLMPDEATIRGYVNAMKERANIPGVRIWKEESTVVRGS